MLTLPKLPEEVRVTLKEADGADPEAYVIFDPITPKMRRRAMKVIWRELDAAGVEEYADLNDDQRRDVGELVSFELIRMGLRDWGGIGDEAGQPVPLTPDQATRFRTATDADRPTGTIDALLADDVILATLDARYVLPDSMRRAEKNGLSGSPNGTSAAATPASATATLAAKPKRKAAAKRAPTSKTRSKPKTAKPSGKS
jgi:hypothetical protein